MVYGRKNENNCVPNNHAEDGYDGGGETDEDWDWDEKNANKVKWGLGSFI